MSTAESDWKKFRKLREVALERFSRRVLDECQAICGKESLTAYDRYGELYRLIHDRNKKMAMAFDAPRRSTATVQLRLMARQGLLTDDELSQFSSETQRKISADW